MVSSNLNQVRLVYSADISRWDALFFGQYDSIQQQEIPLPFQNDTFLRFHRRQPWQNRSSRQDVQQRFIDSAENLTLKLVSGHVDPHSGMNQSRVGKVFNPDQMGFTYGLQCPQNWDRPDEVTINLAFEMLEPLMSAQCTAGERATNIFRVACSLLHETAVRNCGVIFDWPLEFADGMV
jgi:hypothetical protein